MAELLLIKPACTWVQAEAKGRPFLGLLADLDMHRSEPHACKRPTPLALYADAVTCRMELRTLGRYSSSALLADLTHRMPRWVRSEAARTI